MNEFAALLTKHKPGLLIGLGIGSMILATAASWKYSPDAHMAVEEKKEELGLEKLPVIETAKAVLPYALPPIIFTGIGIGCILGGNKVNVERGAAAMMAYTLTQESLREYRAKTREIVGERKERSINDAVAKEILEKNPSNGKEIIITGDGDHLCFDKLSGRYFKSNIEKLRKIENELNRRMLDTTFISLNEFYLALGLNPITLGDEEGWDVGRGLIEMRFSSQLTDKGEPCLVIDFDIGPQNYS